MAKAKLCPACGMQLPYHLWGCPETPAESIEEDPTPDDRDPDDKENEDA